LAISRFALFRKDVLQESIAFIIKVERISELEATLEATSN
jgi:hypothetical protein